MQSDSPVHGVVKLAPAKINLTLDILDKRPDNYHDIRSVMQTVGLYDEIHVETNDLLSRELSLYVVGACAHGVPEGAGNIAYKAAHLILDYAFENGMLQGLRPKLQLKITKNIPHQAGLGGGSSDAASTLIAINELLGLSIGRADLMSLGAAVGADVPFFVHGGLALVEGIGDRVLPLSVACGTTSAVIVKPNFGSDTRQAFGLWDSATTTCRGGTDRWLRSDKSFIDRPLHNDFHDLMATYQPDLLRIASEFSRVCDDQVNSYSRPMLSGSGSSLYVLATSIEAAQAVATETSRLFGMPTWAVFLTGGDSFVTL